MMERPILFSGEMVRAILSGQKTQTRRVVLRFDENRCPYGVPGDRLWVRETWRPRPPYWRADCAHADQLRWRPSIHMPRSASRITLELTAVRLQRVRHISEEDCIQEGYPEPPRGDGFMDHRFRWFIALWDSINAKRGYGWDANPWVWALTFRRIGGGKR